MASTSHGSITKEDVAAFRRHMQQEKKSLTPARARANLIQSGFLREDGQLRYPNPDTGNPDQPKPLNGRK